MISWAYICIIVFVIHIFILLEKTIFSLWCSVCHYRCNTVIDQHLGDCRCLVSSICNYIFWIQLLQFLIQMRECLAIMFVSWVNCVIKYPAIPVACCFYSIRENFFMLTLVESTTFRICSTYLALTCVASTKISSVLTRSFFMHCIRISWKICSKRSVPSNLLL